MHDRRDPGAVRLDEQEAQRQRQHDGHGHAEREQRPRARRAASRRPRRAGRHRPTVHRAAGAGVVVTSGRLVAGSCSQQPGLAQQRDRRRPVAELGDRDRVRLQLVEGRLGRGGADAEAIGYSKLIEWAMISWPCLETRNARNLWAAALVLGGLQDAGARDVEHVAGVARGEVGDLGVTFDAPSSARMPVPVVLVDDPERDRAAVDLVGDRLVVGVDVAAGVRLDRLPATSAPPRRRRCVHTEVTIGWKSVSPAAKASLPLYFGSASCEDRRRQLARGDQARVVDQHADPRRDADPVALRRVVPASGCARASRVDRREQALVLQVLERRRVLGVDHVGGRVRALGDDLVGERVLVVVADVDLDAGRLLEARDERVGRLLVLAVVERDRLSRPGRGEPPQPASRQTSTAAVAMTPAMLRVLVMNVSLLFTVRSPGRGP